MSDWKKEKKKATNEQLVKMNIKHMLIVLHPHQLCLSAEEIEIQICGFRTCAGHLNKSGVHTRVRHGSPPPRGGAIARIVAQIGGEEPRPAAAALGRWTVDQ